MHRSMAIGAGVGVIAAASFISLSLAQSNRAEDGSTLSWAKVLAAAPDPAVVVDTEGRRRIEATGLPWRVVHEASGIEFLLVPPGNYLRGAADDDPYDRANERPQHEVTITRPFYLGRYEVTNLQMRRVRPDHASGNWYRDESWSMDAEELPAVNISYEDALAYCESFGFRLPTEAEWEYAARAGVTTRYPWSNDLEGGAEWGNSFDESTKAAFPEMDWDCFPFEDKHPLIAPVGMYRPNAWGFYDMFCNAWERCIDAYHEDAYARYTEGVASDPVVLDGDVFVLRGGGFGNAPRGSGIPYRWGNAPAQRHQGNGLRVARWP